MSMFIWSQFIGTYQYRDAKSIFILESSGRIEQGPMVQERMKRGLVVITPAPPPPQPQ
jgi:hypothetical protein